MADQFQHNAPERAAVDLSAGVHAVHQLWPAVQEDERMGGVVFFAGRVLSALYTDDPPAADEALHQMDDARSLIGGDES